MLELALLVQHLFGGQIYRCEHEGMSHYFNRIDTQVIDFTADQFDSYPLHMMSTEVATATLLANPDTAGRFNLLRERYLEHIASQRSDTVTPSTQQCYLCNEHKPWSHFIRKKTIRTTTCAVLVCRVFF